MVPGSFQIPNVRNSLHRRHQFSPPPQRALFRFDVESFSRFEQKLFVFVGFPFVMLRALCMYVCIYVCMMTLCHLYLNEQMHVCLYPHDP